MNILRLLLIAALGLACSMRFPVRAQDSAKPAAPKYDMALVWIADAKPRQYVFTINNSVGFQSVDGLKGFIANLPSGSTLQWAPGCRRMGDEPLLSSEKDMNNFKTFCAEHKVTFILVPSG